MTPITHNPPSRILSFDLLKALALMYIIFGWHMDDYAGNILATSIGRTVAIGALGIFVFMSGFTLTRSCRVIATVPDAGRFLKKRFVRIYPLYLAALGLSFATSQISGTQFYSGILLFNAILNIPVNTYWFVTMICIFYLLLPVILYNYSPAKTLFLAIAFPASCIALNRYAGLMDIRLAYYFPIFIWGILCVQHHSFLQLLKRKTWIIFSICMLLVLTYMPNSVKGGWYEHAYIVGSLFFSVSPLIACGEVLARKVESSLIVRLSYASFCMYLFHRIVFFILLQLYTPASDILIVLYLGIAGFPLIYLVSERIQAGYDYLLNKSLLPVFSR